MYPTSDKNEVRTAIPKYNPSRILPVPSAATIIATVAIVFLIWAFFSRRTLQFYASFVFLFYSFTHSMWVSVVLLGVFQTILLIPFRIVNLIKSAHIKDFIEKIEEIKANQEQAFVLKKSVAGGRRVALFYLVNFMVQLTSYVSIGRLFLTDFYTKPLDPWLLYSFVPYPHYPILDRFFKIPYVWFSGTTDLGMHWVWIVWLVILLIQGVLILTRSMVNRWGKKKDNQPAQIMQRIYKVMVGSAVLLMIVAYGVIRHFPIHWSLRLFTGDVAYQNTPFNTLTAIVTFLTLVWINIPQIQKKTELAEAAGVSENVINETQKQLFKDTFLAATLVGLGAFFITNQIPCAFELSVFTLELISLASPLTLDKVILATTKPKLAPMVEKVKEAEGKEVKEETEKELKAKVVREEKVGEDEAETKPVVEERKQPKEESRRGVERESEERGKLAGEIKF